MGRQAYRHASAWQDGDQAVQNWWQRPAELWQTGELLLACGAATVADLRAAVADELGYSCSAGIAHNKILAKLASGMHKPSQQTVIPAPAIPALLNELPVSKLRQLGGKFGDELMAALSIKTVGKACLADAYICCRLLAVHAWLVHCATANFCMTISQHACRDENQQR